MSVMVKVFEIGKCYENTTGRRMHICGQLATFFWEKTLIAEDNRGTLLPIGDTEDAAVNWFEIPKEVFLKEIFLMVPPCA